MGHEVYFFAPDGSYTPPHGKQLSMPCSFGVAWGAPSGPHPPSSISFEQRCYDGHSNILKNLDIVHDFSNTKTIAQNLYNEGVKNIINTPLSGNWLYPKIQCNIVVHSKAMKERGLRGATDYENTPYPDDGNLGIPMPPIKDAHIVNLGIDTDYYYPNYQKKDYFLWMGRWHKIRGYKQAIEYAKKLKFNLIIAAEHPDQKFMKLKEIVV